MDKFYSISKNTNWSEIPDQDKLDILTYLWYKVITFLEKHQAKGQESITKRKLLTFVKHIMDNVSNMLRSSRKNVIIPSNFNNLQLLIEVKYNNDYNSEILVYENHNNFKEIPPWSLICYLFEVTQTAIPYLCKPPDNRYQHDYKSEFIDMKDCMNRLISFCEKSFVTINQKERAKYINLACQITISEKCL